MLNVSQFYLILLTNWKYFLSIVNDYFSHNMSNKLSLKNNVEIIFISTSHASRFTILSLFSVINLKKNLIKDEVITPTHLLYFFEKILYL